MNKPWRSVQANPQTRSFFPSFKLSLMQTWAVFNERFPPRNSAAEISSIFPRNAPDWHNWPARSPGKAPLPVFRQVGPKATRQSPHHASGSPLHQRPCPRVRPCSWPRGTASWPGAGTPAGSGQEKAPRRCGSLLRPLRPCLPAPPSSVTLQQSAVPCQHGKCWVSPGSQHCFGRAVKQKEHQPQKHFCIRCCCRNRTLTCSNSALNSNICGFCSYPFASGFQNLPCSFST